MEQLLIQLLDWATTIKNQTQIEGNSSTLVGGGLEKLISAITDLQTNKADTKALAQLDKELQNISVKFKGYHISETALKAAYPQAENKKDDFAWVGSVQSSYPGTVWKVSSNGGAWTNTNIAPKPPEVNLGEYAKKVDEEGKKVVYAKDGVVEVISKNAVNSNNSDRLTIGVGDNLLDGYTNYIRGQYVDKGTGNLIANAVWNTTNPVFIAGVTKLTAQLVYANGGIFLDNEGNYISGYGIISGSQENFNINVPSNATYIQHNVRENVIDNYQLTIINGSATKPNTNDNIDLILNNLLLTSKQIKQVEKIVVDTTNSRSIQYISLGDSITEQDGKAYTQGNVGAIAVGYQSILKNIYVGLMISNKGVGGQCMTGATNSTYSLGVTQDYRNVDLVTISSATNDFRLNKPMGILLSTLDKTNRNVNTFRGAYQALIEHIISQNPKTKIILLTPIQRHNPPNTVDFVNGNSLKLIDYTNAIIEIGELYGIQTIDMYRNSSINPLNVSSFLMDGVHPNDEGYKLMGDLLTRSIII